MWLSSLFVRAEEHFLYFLALISQLILVHHTYCRQAELMCSDVHLDLNFLGISACPNMGFRSRPFSLLQIPQDRCVHMEVVCFVMT